MMLKSTGANDVLCFWRERPGLGRNSNKCPHTHHRTNERWNNLFIRRIANFNCNSNSPFLIVVASSLLKLPHFRSQMNGTVTFFQTSLVHSVVESTEADEIYMQPWSPTNHLTSKCCVGRKIMRFTGTSPMLVRSTDKTLRYIFFLLSSSLPPPSSPSSAPYALQSVCI